jgi:hypothetical protein
MSYGVQGAELVAFWSAPARRRFSLLRPAAAAFAKMFCALRRFQLYIATSLFGSMRRQAAVGQSGVEPPHSKELTDCEPS